MKKMNKPISAIFLSCGSTRLSFDERQLFKNANPLGITLFSRNIESKTQIKALTDEIKEVIGREDVLIAVDQEGGRVRRLTSEEFHAVNSQLDIGKLNLEDAKKVSKAHAEIISHDLKSVGINLNFAPVLDVIHPQTTKAIYSRSFSSNPETVAILGKIMVDTYIANGIIPCIKHLPGHGNTHTDSHLELPFIDADISEIRKDIIPFINCNNSPFAMTGHILLNAVDSSNPVTQSPKAIQQIIREEIGYNGFLISDAIEMKALKGSIEEKALKSLQAGCDAVCYCLAKIEDMKKLTAICPFLSDISHKRLDNALKILKNKSNINIEKSVETYYSVLDSIEPYRDDYDMTEVLFKLQQ